MTPNAPSMMKSSSHQRPRPRMLEPQRPLRSASSSSSSSESEEEEWKSRKPAPPRRQLTKQLSMQDGSREAAGRKQLKKQLSMQDESREAAWERQRQRQAALRKGGAEAASRCLTDEDLEELKGSIELGFGFNEEGGHELCHTLPALDLYFAVNRQYTDSKHRLSCSSSSTVSTPRGESSSPSGGDQPAVESPRSPHQTDYWKICNPGDNPQHVKQRLRHWAQAVACSVRQSST